MTKREVMHPALDALIRNHDWQTALKSELAKPDTTKDSRFVCAKCGSDDVKIAPMYGSVSRCCNCGHKWANP
jgi:ribosomal protein L37AE/L43A